MRTARGEATPLPPPRPAAAADLPKGAERPAAAAEIPSPPARPAEAKQAVSAPAASPTPASLADESACLERLTKLGVRFESLPAIAQDQCGAPHPLRVSGLPDGLDVSPPATVTCPVAEALARWVKEVVSAEAVRHLETQAKRISIGTSYECRSRNRQAGAKLSEHAFANGVDISGFEFDRRKAIRIAAHPPESPEALFQNAVRMQACAYFTTVLGPGADAAHGDHLHLDLRGRSNGYRICQ
jgi:hypothetical protein